MRLFHVVSVSKQDRMMYNYKSLFETTLSGTLNYSVKLIPRVALFRFRVISCEGLKMQHNLFAFHLAFLQLQSLPRASHKPLREKNEFVLLSFASELTQGLSKRINTPSVPRSFRSKNGASKKRASVRRRQRDIQKTESSSLRRVSQPNLQPKKRKFCAAVHASTLDQS